MEQNKRVVLSHRVTVNTGTFEIIDGYQHLTILQKESYIFYDEPRDSIYPDERDYKLEDYTDDPWIWSPRIIDWMTENTYGTSGGLSFFRLEEYPHDVQAYPKLWGFGDPYADWLAKFD